MSEIVEPIIEKKLRRRRKPLLPHSLEDRLDLLKREIRVPATLDEYFVEVETIRLDDIYKIDFLPKR